MKAQIKKLIELAGEFQKYGVLIGLPNTHNVLRGDSVLNIGEKCFLGIYFSDKRKTWSVTFGGVTISDYSKKLEIPYNVTPKHLTDLYDSAKEFLAIELAKPKEDLDKLLNENKDKRLEELKKEIQELEGDGSK